MGRVSARHNNMSRAILSGKDTYTRPKSLEPKAAPTSSNKKGSSDDKYYGSGKSMSDRFRNFVTGGASDTLKKAAK